MIPRETIGSTLGEVALALANAGFDEPRPRARRLLAIALEMSPEEVFARLDRMLAEAEGRCVASVLRRALAHEPPSRIRGCREFWGLDFALSPDTLDPRPETETIVDAVLARLPERNRPYRLLDLGTGTGCLLSALLSELPGARGIGVDRAFGAAATARANAEHLDLGDRARFIVGDWAAALGSGFDAIVANPPYIATGDIARLPREVRQYDPVLALDGGADGLEAYRAIAGDLPRLLDRDGTFACEIGLGQAACVAEILAGQGLVVEEIAPDLAGIPRCIVARRVT
jgi:release factor glutamine methyltransferase